MAVPVEDLSATWTLLRTDTNDSMGLVLGGLAEATRYLGCYMEAAARGMLRHDHMGGPPPATGMASPRLSSMPKSFMSVRARVTNCPDINNGYTGVRGPS